MSEITSAALPPEVKIRAYITSTPFWWGKGSQAIRICYLSGIKNSYPHWGGPARIDASIVNLIKYLNEAGLETDYCCSHRPCDHKHLCGAESWVNGFVSFARELPASFIAMLPEGTYVTDSDIGDVRNCQIKFKQCSDRECAKLWKQLERVTLRWRGIQEGY